MSSLRKYDIIAANLLFVGFLFGTIINLVSDSSFFNSTIFTGPASWILAVISTIVVLGHYYYIGQGYQWAKILFFVFFSFSIISLLIGFKQVIDTQFATSLKGISFTLQWLSRILAFVLLVISFRQKRDKAQ